MGIVGLLSVIEIGGLMMARNDGYVNGYADGRKAKAAAEYGRGVAEGRFDAARARPRRVLNFLEVGADYFNASLTAFAGGSSITYTASGKSGKLDENICVRAPEETTCYFDTDFFYHPDDKNKHDGLVDRVVVAKDGTFIEYRRQDDYDKRKDFYDEADDIFVNLKGTFGAYGNP